MQHVLCGRHALLPADTPSPSFPSHLPAHLCLQLGSSIDKMSMIDAHHHNSGYPADAGGYLQQQQQQHKAGGPPPPTQYPGGAGGKHLPSGYSQQQPQQQNLIRSNSTT